MITFLPLGFSLGFILYQHIMSDNVSSGADFSSVMFPFVLAICGSLLSTITMMTVKLHAKKYLFEHLYIIMAGLLFFITGSNKMLSNSDGNFNHFISIQ